MISKEDLLKFKPYWVETIDGCFTLAVHVGSEINIKDWNNDGRGILTDIAREQLEKLSGEKVHKLDSSRC